MLVQEILGNSFRSLKADKLSASLRELCRENGDEHKPQRPAQKVEVRGEVADD